MSEKNNTPETPMFEEEQVVVQEEIVEEPAAEEIIEEVIEEPEKNEKDTLLKLAKSIKNDRFQIINKNTFSHSMISTTCSTVRAICSSLVITGVPSPS